METDLIELPAPRPLDSSTNDHLSDRTRDQPRRVSGSSEGDLIPDISLPDLESSLDTVSFEDNGSLSGDFSPSISSTPLRQSETRPDSFVFASPIINLSLIHI